MKITYLAIGISVIYLFTIVIRTIIYSNHASTYSLNLPKANYQISLFNAEIIQCKDVNDLLIINERQ